jgi:hypothetical protein
MNRDDMDRFKDVPEYLRIHTNRLCDNLARVDSLINLYDYASTLLRRHEEAVRQGHVQPMERAPDPLEILRASTVFLHASLEDVLRSMAAKHISRTNRDVLKDVPFLDSGIRANKASLADLLRYQGETIEGLIDKSVNQWLEHQSFNDCNDIAAFLQRIGIDSTACNSECATLDEMIKRRHKIVHNADRRDVYDESKYSTLESIDRDTVIKWRESVQRFVVIVMHELQTVVDPEQQQP